MAEVGEVFLRIKARLDSVESDVERMGNRLAAKMDDAGKKGEKAFADRMKGLGKGLGDFGKKLSIGVSAPLALLATKGVRDAGALQQAVANISTIKPEINTSEVFKSLNEMQRRVPQTAKELSDSLYDVFSSIDVPVADGVKLVEKFAKGALGAGASAQTFGTAVMGVMNAYKKTTADADLPPSDHAKKVNRRKSVLSPVAGHTSDADVFHSARAAATKRGEVIHVVTVAKVATAVVASIVLLVKKSVDAVNRDWLGHDSRALAGALS